MSKQSSVEFLEIQLIKNGIITNSDLKQAKEMHKQEIEEAFKHGELPHLFVNLNAKVPHLFVNLNAKDYYNQTFEQ